MFNCSPVYYATLNSTADIVVNQGGTYSTKTYSIIQVLFSLAISQPGKIITITGEDIPNLKRGSLRDAQTVLASSPELQSTTSGYNATERIFKFHSGSIIEFVSYMNEQDARNGKRDYLFINEANGISWEIAEQLINRTNVRTFIDYNPSAEFWAHEKLIYPKMFGNKSVQLIISDHRHNPFISQDMHDHIEKRALEDPEWGRVYARGLTGKIEGLIFRNWSRIDDLPKEPDGKIKAEYLGTGLDFGFTNDPTAVIDVYRYNGELILDEVLYSAGLTNPEIAAKLDRKKAYFADSAEPKSIEEIRRLGYNITATQKGADSIVNSIDILKRFKISITARSFNLIKEFNAYKWRQDKDGRTINEPVDFLNHGIDAVRYFALMKLKQRGITGVKFA